MEKIPTAEDFLQDHLQISHFYDDKAENMVCYSNDVQKAMIDFAKLHVKAALEAAANKKTYGMLVVPLFTDEQKESILNAYPESNIQ